MSRVGRPRKDRPKRTPIGSRNVLTTDQREGFVRRWVNDEPGRVDMFKEAGYEVVGKTNVGDPRVGSDSNLGSSVTRKSVGGGQHAVLMEISEEYYQEDSEAKEQAIKAKEQALIPNELKDGYGEGVTMSRSLEGGSPKVIIQ